MFSEILKSLRTQRGLSQGQLAKEVGVSTGNIGDWEIGRSKPGYSALVSLARYFGISADYLLELSPVNTLGKSVTSNLSCDGVPLTESEADLIAMYRLVPEADKQTIFDIAKLKYEQSTGEKVSIYSTYTDVKERQKSGSDRDDKSATGTA